MSRLIIPLTVLALLLYAGSIHVYAQRSHGGGPPSGVGAGAGTGTGHGLSATPGPSSASNSTHSSQPDTGKRSVNDMLTQNTKLASQIHDLTGMDAQQACSGFKNLGQCVAAAHVAHNLGGTCTFGKLKGEVTGSSSESLGRAIHGCNPHVDAKAEAKKGKKQADDDLKET